MERRLAAILAADVVGYSRLMGDDEAGTLERLKALRKDLVQPSIAKRKGRTVKLTGDGLLAEFPSVVEAVQCAVDIQQDMAGRDANFTDEHRIRLRIGVNLGDLIVEGSDIYGDGVNMAARLEGLAEPGGICISGKVYEEVKSKLATAFEDLGEQKVKNIREPVRVYRWADTVAVATSDMAGLEGALPLPDKQSVAVLPFQNMSGDPEQNFFVDGIVEDILTTLSKVPKLFVIARNSSFTYQGKFVDIRQVGRELGVEYVVEGSVRKSGSRVRVTAQLVECATGGHLWADRFDGKLDNVFELQDHITQEIVTALQVTLTEGEQARIWRERSGSPLAYEAFQRAHPLYRTFTKQTHRQALQELNRALAINPEFTPALVVYGFISVDQARFGWDADRNAAFAAALDATDRALAVDPYYGEAYTVACYARTFQGRHNEAVAAAEKAVSLSPNSADANHMTAMSYIFASEFADALTYGKQAARLSPMERSVYQIELARTQYHLGAFEEARYLAAQVLGSKPHWLTAQSILLAALWRLDRLDEARDIATMIMRGHPKFSVARWAKGWPYRLSEDLAGILDPLLSAGLPK